MSGVREGVLVVLKEILMTYAEQRKGINSKFMSISILIIGEKWEFC